MHLNGHNNTETEFEGRTVEEGVMSQLIVDIVTPTKKVVEKAAASALKVPGAKGELEILPGHTELLTILNAGVVALVQDGKERRFAIGYGFAEVKNDRVLVLAETIEEAHEIDKARAAAAQKKAEAALTGALSPSEFRKHQAKLQRSFIRQGL